MGALVPFVAVPVTAAWNGVVMWRVLFEARVRAMGPSAIDQLLGLCFTSVASWSPAGRLAGVRAVASAIVRTQDLHPNLVHLLAQVRARAGELGPAELDDVAEFLRALPQLAAAERHLALQLLAIACVVDGRLSTKEQHLWCQALTPAEPSSALLRLEQLRRAFVNGDALDGGLLRLLDRAQHSVVNCALMCMRVVMVLLLGSGCGQVREAQAELGAAKARLAALEAQAEALRARQKELVTTVATFKAEADAAEVARRELRAASEVLGGKPVPVAYQLHQALLGRGDAATIANASVLRPLTCEDATPASPGQQGDEVTPSCEPAALEDACADVPRLLSPVWHFTCEKVISLGGRQAVVCQAPGETPGVPAHVVRVAFLHQGRIAAADWPSNEHDLHRPPNDEGQASCAAENDRNECLRACDVQFGKVSLPYECGQGEGDRDGMMPNEDDEGDPTATPESPELQAARRELQAAEAQAASAAQARADAELEVSYQECNSRCARPVEAPDAPTQATMTVAYPAAGYLLITETRTDDGTVSATTDLVRASGWLDGAPSDAGLDSIEVLASFSAYTVSGSSIAGLDRGVPVGVKLNGAQVDDLSTTETCALLEKNQLHCDGGAP